MSAADIQAKAFTDNDVAREAIEALDVAERPRLPALRLHWENRQDRRQVGAPRPLLLRRLPGAVLRDGRHRL